jgi:hypothetical protein
MTYQFVKHLKFMQLNYSRKRLFIKIGIMVVGAFARVIYNIYYILAVSVFSGMKGWIINLDLQCVRVYKYYGLIQCAMALALFILPIFGAHSLFNSPLASSQTAEQRHRSVLSAGSRASL